MIGRQRLDLEHVQCSSANAAIPQRVDERFVIDGGSTADVDEHRARPHRGDSLARQQPVRGRRERSAHDDVVGLRDHLIERGLTEFLPAADGQDVHSERSGTAADGLANAAIADDPDRASLQSLDRVRLPSPLVLIADHATQVLREPEHRRDREFAERVGVETARIRDDDVRAAQQIEREKLHTRGERVNPAHASEVAPELRQQRSIARCDQHRIGTHRLGTQRFHVGSDRQRDVGRLPAKDLERSEIGRSDDEETHRVRIRNPACDLRQSEL